MCFLIRCGHITQNVNSRGKEREREKLKGKALKQALYFSKVFNIFLQQKNITKLEP